MAKKAAGKKKVGGKKKGGAAPSRTRARARDVRGAVKKAASKIGAAAKAVGGAVQKAVGNFAKNLGEMKIDDAAAADQMRELGGLLEDVARAKNNADTKAEEAKTAKSTFESKVNLFLEKTRGFTHPKSLPLFEAAEREADQRNMLDAAADQGKDDAAAASGTLGL